MKPSALLLLSCLLVGCTHHVTIRFPNTLPTRQSESHWVNGFLWNLIGGETDASLYCGDAPVARIDVKKSFTNKLVSVLTFGIYTPMHVRMQCAVRQGPAPGVYAPPPPGYAPAPGYAPPPPSYAPAPPPGYGAPAYPPQPAQ